MSFVTNLKIDAIYALYPESFCDKNLAVRKVFAFSDSEDGPHRPPPNLLAFNGIDNILHWLSVALLKDFDYLLND